VTLRRHVRLDFFEPLRRTVVQVRRVVVQVFFVQVRFVVTHVFVVRFAVRLVLQAGFLLAGFFMADAEADAAAGAAPLASVVGIAAAQKKARSRAAAKAATGRRDGWTMVLTTCAEPRSCGFCRRP